MIERKQRIRRELNASLMSKDGGFSWPKLIAIAGQLVLLYKLAFDFATVAKDWSVFGITISAILAPDILKKIIALRFGDRPAQPSLEAKPTETIP